MSIGKKINSGLYESFKLSYKNLEKEAESIKPNNSCELTIKLKNGDVIVYDQTLDSIRKIHCITDESSDEEWGKEFGIRLKKKMKLCQVTYPYMAEAIGITRQTIYNYTNGKGIPNIRTVDKMARYLKCDIKDLIP